MLECLGEHLVHMPGKCIPSWFPSRDQASVITNGAIASLPVFFTSLRVFLNANKEK